MKILRPTDKDGAILLGIVITFPFLILMAVFFMNLSISSFRLARHDQAHTHAQLSVDAGIDVAMQEINLDGDWEGTGGETELFNDGNVRTTYDVTVTTVDEDNKTIRSVGRSYQPAGSSTPTFTVNIEVKLRPVRSGLSSVVTGVGGLYMSNSAKILGGDVKVNGEISMSNTAQIGLSSTPVNVDVAHQNCPNPATSSYPQLCGLGENGQPITISNSAHIYGTVRANNQTNASGMSNPGLTASSGVVPEPLPNHDRAAQVAAVAQTQTGSWGSCSSGTKTWPANLRLTGNVTISGGCRVMVEGNVWIDGTFQMSNTSQLIVSDALGSNRPTIMVDGTVARFRNSSRLIGNGNNTGFQIITYWSRASCSPGCSDVTGTDLYNSRNDTTIDLDNSAEGPNTMFYARWTRVSTGNSGQIGALVGQTIEMKNSSTITFGTSIGAGNTYWVIDGYRRVFD